MAARSRKDILMDYKTWETQDCKIRCVKLGQLFPHPQQRFVDEEHVQAIVESFVLNGQVITRELTAFLAEGFELDDEQGRLNPSAQFQVIRGNHRVLAVNSLARSGHPDYFDPEFLVKVISSGESLSMPKV